MARNASLAYILPFAVFIAMLVVNSFVPVPQWARFVIEVAVIASVSLSALSGKPQFPFLSVFVGAGVFLLWIAPDQLFPSYRSLPIFNNALVGRISGASPQHDPLFLTFRVLNSVVTVPILEELFWRGFLMRWLMDRDFRSVRLGTYTASAFWIVALLFASEHGTYWDVGLLAGVAYNLWIIRTRNLLDSILAHAVTNACLAAWVIHAGHWQYWI
jgi:CAAX prenyl protease-like protein